MVGSQIALAIIGFILFFVIILAVGLVEWKIALIVIGVILFFVITLSAVLLVQRKHDSLSSARKPKVAQLLKLEGAVV